MRILKNRVEYLKELKRLLPANPICAEIGVYRGDFSYKLYDNLCPEKLYLIDPFATMADPVTKEVHYPDWGHGTVYSSEENYEEVCTILSSPIAEGRVVIDRNLSTEAIGNYKDSYFDFIYIDACHLYEAVLWDMENYIPKLKKGGYLGGHDYIDHPSFGVNKAVDDFCKKYDYQMIVLVEGRFEGDWLLSPKK